MSLKKVYEQLGLSAEYEKEVVSFTERLLIVLDSFRSDLKADDVYDDIYGNIIKEFAFLIGESHYYNKGYGGAAVYLPLTEFFEKGGIAVLTNNVKRLYLLLMAVKTATVEAGSYHEAYYLLFLAKVKRLFDTTPVEIGYVFAKETIIKKGAEELDEKLVLENLKWLSSYPNARTSFQASLTRYLSKDYPDAITNAYSALESLSKTFLNKDKRLDSTEMRAELIKVLGLKERWGQLLYNYSELAHEVSSRHGKLEGKEPEDISPELVEFYIYLTGTFVRLIVQRISKPKPQDSDAKIVK
ncbi:MAG: hypothetical protein ABSC55_11845 [Syntrophorhabdales bacterium]|jgi:hypothetical protein